MPHISKRKLSKSTHSRINLELGNLLEKLVRLNRKEAFIYELLTYTERIMLAKRLAIIIMLESEHSYYEVARDLKVSPSTVARFDVNIDRGKYTRLVASIKKGHGRMILERIVELIAIPLTTPYKGTRGIKLNFDT